MTILPVKGQRVDLTRGNPGLQELVVNVGWKNTSSLELDTSAFLLGKNGKVSGDNDLIFYNHPTNSFISYIDSTGDSNKKQFKIDIRNVHSDIEKIAFTLTIYEGEKRGQSFRSLHDVNLSIQDRTTGQVLVTFHLDSVFSIETAVVIGELYRHHGEWKFNAIGSGFSNGLNALCENFGVDVQEKPKMTPQVQPKPEPKLQTPQPVTKPESTSTTPAPINLTKIELKKRGQTISLEKKSGNLGEILVNLNWNQKRESTSLFRRSQGIDLDLACLYELKDGSKGVVQALGERFGTLTREPYISLDGDDRTGAVMAGENLRINGNKIKEFKRILVFTFIYEGITNWSEADGVVTLKQTNGPDIIVALNEHDNSKAMCAIAMIRNVNDETFSVERLVQFYPGHSELDKAYNWGLRWVAGRK
jgi:tellurite resistance protein TerA